MKIFLINLDKNPERLEKTRQRLTAIGVEFERIPAIYGKTLSDEEKKRSVNAFRWWCAQGRPIREGEIGCALSHYMIYRKMIAENMTCACILEDDNAYRDSFAAVVEEMERLLNVSKPQVILLTNLTEDKAVGQGVEVRPAVSDYTTSAYIITLPAAKVLLSANFPMHVPCDYWKRWVKRGLIELYHSFPTLAAQDGRQFFGDGIETDKEFTSDIEVGKVDRVSEYGIVRFVLHKIKRLIGCLIDNLLPL